MKKFTKLLSLLLAVVMMLGLAACGSNGTTETAAPTAADVSAETKADTAAAPTAPAAVTFRKLRREIFFIVSSYFLLSRVTLFSSGKLVLTSIPFMLCILRLFSCFFKQI